MNLLFWTAVPPETVRYYVFNDLNFRHSVNRSPLCQRVFERKPETKDQFLIVGHAGQQLELTDQISFGDWTKMNLCIFALAILLEIDQVRRTRFDEIHHLLLDRLKSFEISNFEVRRTKTDKNSNASELKLSHTVFFAFGVV